MALDTPSGTATTALDQLILRYTGNGYKWLDRARASILEPQTRQEQNLKQSIEIYTQTCDDIIFYKPDSVLVAEAQYDEEVEKRIVKYIVWKLH